MCQIIYRPRTATAEVTPERLQHCARINNDGYGLMWRDNGRILTDRFLWKDRKLFYERFLELQRARVEFCAHFRMKTHGLENKENTHPFWVHRGEQAVMHNGIFYIKCPEGWSDTRTFVTQVLRPLPRNWLDIPHLRFLVESATSGNRLAVMTKRGVTVMGNGVWEDGIWYANDGYKPNGKYISSYSWGTYSEGHYGDYGNYKATKWLSDVRKDGATTLPDTPKALPPASSESQTAMQELIESRTTNGGKFQRPSARTTILYSYAGYTICSDCLQMEGSSDGGKATLLFPLRGDERCEFCLIRGMSQH